MDGERDSGNKKREGSSLLTNTNHLSKAEKEDGHDYQFVFAGFFAMVSIHICNNHPDFTIGEFITKFIFYVGK